MGVCAERDQCVGQRQHTRGHVGMQIEAGDDRRSWSDHLAQAREQLAFAVVEMGGHHGAVQVEIEGVRPCGAGGLDNLAGNSFECVLCDVSRRAGGGPDHRQQDVA